MKIAGSAKNPCAHVRNQPKIIIEHLEPELSKWLLFEYESASNIFKKKVWFTNIKNNGALKKLKKLGTTKRQSVLKIFPHEKLLILDPCAKKALTPDDLKDAIAVVGGILGDHPARGRTRNMLTSKTPNAKSRNLGREQLTIDGAAYFIEKIVAGKKISTIPLKHGLVLKTKLKPSGIYEVVLPYAYPIANGSPIISKKLLKYLTGSSSPEII